MTQQNESARGADIAPGADITISPDEQLVQAAARVLARHHHPEWRPNTDDIDGYGHGYADGHRQGYTDGWSV